MKKRQNSTQTPNKSATPPIPKKTIWPPCLIRLSGWLGATTDGEASTHSGSFYSQQQQRLSPPGAGVSSWPTSSMKGKSADRQRRRPRQEPDLVAHSRRHPCPWFNLGLVAWHSTVVVVHVKAKAFAGSESKRSLDDSFSFALTSGASFPTTTVFWMLVFAFVDWKRKLLFWDGKNPRRKDPDVKGFLPWFCTISCCTYWIHFQKTETIQTLNNA